MFRNNYIIYLVVYMPWYTCFGQIELLWQKAVSRQGPRYFCLDPSSKGCLALKFWNNISRLFFILDKNITKKKCIDEIFTYWKFINWYFLILPYNWRKMFQKIAPKYYSIYVKGGSLSNACWLRTKSIFYPTNQINGTFML